MSTPPQPPAAGPAPNQRVLLVDDEADIRTIAELSLRRVGGRQVALAPSAQDALARFADVRPDVVLLDVMMPGMDGPSALRALRASGPEGARVPVIFMTAKVQRHEVEGYLALGAAGVIQKPFDPMTMPAEVRRIVAAAAAAPPAP